MEMNPAMRRKLLPLLAIMALAALPAHSADHPLGMTHAGDAEYRAAVDDARAGRLALGLAELQSLRECFPERQDMLGDLAVVLGWAGNDQAALALLDRIVLPTAPLYLVEGLANSARHLQRYDLAESLYRGALLRFPQRLELQTGLAWTLLDAQNLDAAAALVADLRARFPEDAAVLIVFAEVACARHEYFAALAAYQSLLARQPADRAALRGKISTLARLGAPQLAIDLADRNPGVMTPGEREAIAADVTAHQIRWGAIAADTGRGTARFAIIDRALEASALAGTRALDPLASLSVPERELALDRFSALRERSRMREAIELYSALALRAEPIPAYAQSAAASAYLYLEQPEKARDLYREALRTDPGNLESQIGLFYALAECEEHDAALAQIEGTLAATPQWIAAWSPATVRDNPDYARVLAARAMAPLFANRPGEAEQRLHELTEQVPYNMEVRTDWASAMRARGWPRLAEQELRWILAVDPANSGALGEHAGALLEMRDYRAADAALALAQSVAAEDGRVLRAARLAQVNKMRELIVDGTFGRSTRGPRGTQDYAVDSWLFSSPIADNYRAYAHAFNAQAKFDDGTGKRERGGAGLEYRSPLLSARAELSHDINESKTAGAHSIAVTPDDYWTVRVEYDQSANETPLDATLAGIDAHRVAGEMAWRASESRAASLAVDTLDFSDGNRRDSATARWTERVVSGPVYKLAITGGLYASRNSQSVAAYFNPARDFSPTLEFANEWLQWRRYTRAFSHRLVVSGGDYAQQGFATKPVFDAHYEQAWEADDRLTLRYGIGRGEHPYDGVQTTRNYVYFYLDGKF